MNPLAEALRELLSATYHMSDTSPKTGARFPEAHRAGRDALAAYDRQQQEANNERTEG